jgi:sec-independent protein translocase protein TatA
MTFLFFNFGGGEIFVILFITLMLFGAKRIPSIARNLGKGIRQIKDATSDIQRDIQDSANDIKREVNKTNPLKDIKDKL